MGMPTILRRELVLLILFACLAASIPVISVPRVFSRQTETSNSDGSIPSTSSGNILKSQWKNPKETLSVLLIIGGDIVQKAIAQMTGVVYLQIQRKKKKSVEEDRKTAPSHGVGATTSARDNSREKTASDTSGIITPAKVVSDLPSEEDETRLGAQQEHSDLHGESFPTHTYEEGHSTCAAEGKDQIKASARRHVSPDLTGVSQIDLTATEVCKLDEPHSKPAIAEQSNLAFKVVCFPYSSPLPEDDESTGYWRFNFTPVAFSFGWVGYAFVCLNSVLGEGLLMPQTDTPATLINLDSGTTLVNESWVLGRLIRDLGISPLLNRQSTALQARTGVELEKSKPQPKHKDAAVYLYKTKKNAGEPRIGWLWLASLMIPVQWTIASIPIWALGRRSDEQNWIILMITVIGTVLAFLTGAIPQWQVEKFPARRNGKGNYILTKGNGHNTSYVILNPQGEKQSMKLEDLTIVHPEVLKSPSTKIYVPALTLCWIFLLLCVGGLENDTWYLFAVGLLGMAQNVVLAGARRHPDTHGLPIEPATEGREWILQDSKIMNVLMNAELVRPHVGIRLRSVFFEDVSLNVEEKRFWARQKRTVVDREKRRVKAGNDLLDLQSEVVRDDRFRTQEERGYIHRAKIVFVLGAPGCGKGTRCKIIHDEKDYTHLSVGDHVRYLATAKVPNEARGGLTHEELQVYLDEMELVPAATIVAIIKHQIIMASEDGKKRFLIDGFPRNEQSAKLFEEEVKQPQSVLLFECPRATAEKRFMGRNREETDTSEIFTRRYKEFEESNAIIVRRYSEKGVLKTIDTSGSITEEGKRKLFRSLKPEWR